MIEENTIVTNNYITLKRNYDQKKVEFTQLITELEESKTACRLAIKENKKTQVEYKTVLDQRNELVEKSKSLDIALNKKERDISELALRVNETVNDYEEKLARKEKQLWNLTVQVNEESEKLRVREMDFEVSSPPVQMPVFVSSDTDVEKKFMEKEMGLKDEVERLRDIEKEKEEAIKSKPKKIILDKSCLYYNNMC